MYYRTFKKRDQKNIFIPSVDLPKVRYQELSPLCNSPGFEESYKKPFSLNFWVLYQRRLTVSGINVKF